MGFLQSLLSRRTAEPTRKEPHLKRTRSSIPRNTLASIIGGIDGARMDRFTASWSSTPTPPDQWVRSWLQILKARSRDLAMNDPYMRRFVRAVRANVVGHAGPKLKCAVKLANGKSDDTTNDAVSLSWALWTRPEACDIRKRQSLTEIAATVVSSVAIDGEAFVKFVVDDYDGLQLQLIDSIRCPSDFDVESTAQGTFIRSGIEYNSDDQPIAYYFSVDHQHGNYYAFDGRSFDRVSADEVCHIFRTDMVGQRRGFPWATSVLFRLKRLKQFEESAAIAAEVGAKTMGVIEFPDDEARDLDDIEPILFKAEAGGICELPGGARLNTFNPTYPSEAMGPFSKHLLRGISAGMGTSYPTAANDLSDANYSSIRAGLIEERDLWKEDQQLIISQFFIPVFTRWLTDALLRGTVGSESGTPVPPSKLKRILRGTTFHPRRWDWVDPKSDAIANREAMTALIKSPQEIIRERGHDPEKVLEEFAAWWKQAEKLGIPIEALQNAWGDTVSETTTNTNAAIDEGKANDNGKH